MHKRKLLYFTEPKVETILRRQLLQHGYRVYAKVRLRDVLAHDKGERLPDNLFDYLTRAHLDFLITKDYVGVFAVEFDGLHHINDPKIRERDALKNSLCKSADLPILRINSTEIYEQDQITILDYMLMRYVAWQQEHEEIFSQIRDFALNIPPGVDPHDYAVDLDPTFHFNLRHPFPGTKKIHERLWIHFKIAWDLGSNVRIKNALYLCDVMPHSGGALGRDEFHYANVKARLWKVGDSPDNAIFEEVASTAIRSYLPLTPEVPDLREFSVKDMFSDKWFEQMELRIKGIWFPDLPGINPWDISENYAEYLGFRTIERWARENLSART